MSGSLYRKKFVFRNSLLISRSLLDGRNRVRASNRVHRITPVELEVLTKFFLESSLDSLEDILEDAEGGWVLLVIALALIHTCTHQTCVPTIHVASNDIGLRVIADHVDVLWESLLIVDGIHPGGHDFVRVLVCCQFGFAIHHALELDTGDGFVDCFEGDAEGSLGHAGLGVLGWAEQVALGEVDWDSLGDGVFGAGPEDAILGLEKIHDDLKVRCIIARVGENEDCTDLDFAKVSGIGCRALVGSEEFLQR